MSIRDDSPGVRPGRRGLLYNSLVWALMVFASAVILQGSDAFIAMLIVLLMGAVASDAVLAREAA
jgi:hypothetical protein